MDFKSPIFFSNYLCQENFILRFDFFPATYSNAVNHFYTTTKSNNKIRLSVSRSFPLSSSYSFVRFYNLIFSAFPNVNPLVSKRRSNFFVRLDLTSYFSISYVFFKFYKLSLGPKSSFMSFFYDFNSGYIRFTEPHVVFNAVSPYFDYHGSRLNLSFSFKFSSTNPYTMNLFNLFFVNVILLNMRSRKNIFLNASKSISHGYINRFTFRTISRNQHLNNFFRFFSFHVYNISVSSSAYITRAKNVCFFTGRSRGMVNVLCISRLTFKENLMNGGIFGYKRSQW